ncbi:hypothetical protein D3C76_1812260 [compost metagenome]
MSLSDSFWRSGSHLRDNALTRRVISLARLELAMIRSSDWRASTRSGSGRLSQLRQASPLLVIAASG